MYRGQRVAVVMPAYNVQHYIRGAIQSVPGFVDVAIIVDDHSRDATVETARRTQRNGKVLLQHSHNRGVGAAIATGYQEALTRGADLIAVMAGDGQMDPADLTRLLDPLVERRADYVKGNRFRHSDLWRAMPLGRIVGNVALSVLTKLSSGYLRIFDSQCGYTAASQRTIRALGNGFFPRYGYPNDILARLRSIGAQVIDVPVRPVYDGQPSGIRLWTVLYPMLFVLLRSMFRRWVALSRRAISRQPPLLQATLMQDTPATSAPAEDGLLALATGTRDG